LPFTFIEEKFWSLLCILLHRIAAV